MSPVKNLSPFFRRIAKFLLVAIMLQAVMPAFAAQHNAKNGLSSAGWVEVCSAQGSKWVAQDNHPGSSQHASAHADHCVFCSATGAGAEFDATAAVTSTSGMASRESFKRIAFSNPTVQP
jgi:hypothetical protein